MHKVGLLFLLLASNFVFAQNTGTKTINNSTPDFTRCVNMQEYELLLEKQDLTRKARRDSAVKVIYGKIEQQKLDRKAEATQYTIPVVFHVLWNSATPAEKISLAQIKTQVKVLNRDYNRLNTDTVKTPSSFQPVASSFHITFCLAQTDPNGNATTGVVYKQTTSTAFSYTNNGAKQPFIGGDTIWNPNKYLNIWVCNLGGGLLGYSELPTMPLDNTYGSVIFYEAIGDSGYLPLAAYNLGRTVSHEVGHLLNLHHPWGDDGGLCPGSGGVDDGVADTPPEGNGNSDVYTYNASSNGATFGCPPFPYTDNCSTTSPGIMFENFMEYTDDNCMNIFTKGQYAIAQAVMSGPLLNLVASTTCNPPNGIEEYLFSSSISIYPNPSTGSFTVSINQENSTHNTIEVLDLLGQTVAKSNSDKQNNTIDLSGEPNGLYFFKITNDTYSIVKKIMVLR